MSDYLDDLGLSRTFSVVNGHLAVEDSVDKVLESAFTQGLSKHSASLIGTVVDSKYKVLSLLGEGGMGSVYRVRHLLLDKEMALKTLRTGKLSPEAWARFQREAQAIGKLTHVNIVQVFDFGISEQNLPYFTMELLIGGSLADRLKRTARLDIDEALPIFIDVASGMAHAHSQGIVHRDIKPSNIFMQRGQGKDTPKIVDFGLAKLATSQSLDKQSLTAKGLIFGSPLYMSPEQSLGLNSDQRTDIYSFGCSLFQALTGTPPFVGQGTLATISLHHNQLPPRLAAAAKSVAFPERLEVIMDKLLRKNPEERYQTLLEVQSDLKKVVLGGRIETSHLSSSKNTPIPKLPQSSPEISESGSPAGLQKMGVLAGFATIIVGAGITIAFIASVPVSQNKIVPHESTSKGSGKSDSTGAEPRPAPDTRYDDDQAKLISASDKSMDALVWDGKPFFKGIVKHSGRDAKLWEFPQSGPPGLGSLFLVETPYSLVSMAGRVYFAPADRVCLWPNTGLILYPDLKNGLTDGNFDSLVLASKSKSQFDELAAILAKLKSIHGLYIYDIADADGAFESKCLQVINHYPNLTRLQVETLVDGRAVSQIRRLKMLQHLHLGAVKKNESDAFASIRGLNQLTALYLTDFPVTSDAVKDICTCSNLEKLKFFIKHEKIQIQSFAIESLASLKKLKCLRLESISYSPALIQTLGKFRSLTVFECRLDRNWSRGQRMALRKALPNTDLSVYWPGADQELQQLHYLPGQSQPAGMSR